VVTIHLPARVPVEAAALGVVAESPSALGDERRPEKK
jgi:hypothetical protein